MSSIVKIEHVTKKMKSLVALDDISLEISEPGIYGFVGPNGSGKSLIFKTILGFLKPDSGQVFVHGKKLRKASCLPKTLGIQWSNMRPWPTRPAGRIWS